MSVLRAEGLVKSYRSRTVVKGIDLSVRQGEIVGLLGPNGAGKTTTFYMIVGLAHPDRGRVLLDAEDISGLPMYRRARKGINYLPQEPSVFRKLRVAETENVKVKLPDLDKQIIDYRLLTVKGSIKEHTIDVEEVILDASVLGMLAQGKFNLQSQTLDLYALVIPVNRVQRIVGKIPVLGKLLGGSLVSVPVKITGNMSDPEVTFLSPSAIGSAFFGIIERTLKLPITIIEPIMPGKK